MSLSRYPLSFTQQRLWFIDRFESTGSLYNISRAFEIHGSLDHSALRRSLDAVVARHSVLRTNFLDLEGEPVQVIRPIGAADFRIHDVSHSPGSAREVDQLLGADADRTFDLERDPLFRATLFITGDRQVLLLTLHHIVADGWSMGILYRQLEKSYRELVSGREAEAMSPLPMQFADYALLQRQALDVDRMQALVDHWQTTLAGAPTVLELPTDRARPARQSHRGASLEFSLPADLTASLKRLSRQEQVTLFMTLLAAFKTLLFRYSGQTDLSVGTPIASRSDVRTEEMIGFFANTLVLRSRLAPDLSFRALLQQVRATCLDAYARQDLPFDRLVKVLRPPRSLAVHPLFQVSLAFENTPEQLLRLPGVVVAPVPIPTTTSKFDLHLSLREERSEIVGSCEFNTDLFDRSTIQRFCRHYEVLLRGAVAQPDDRLATLPVLDVKERDQVLVAWNRTAAAYPRDASIPRLFDAKVAANPEAIAVVGPDSEITYRDLNLQANRLARHLRERGVDAGAVVGVAVERSIDAVIALLAILKAGATYLPLDASYPDERLAFMIEDAGVLFVLTGNSVPAREWGPAEEIAVGGETAEWRQRQHDGTALDVQTDSSDLAYVMYTSGSTGLPKGVAVSHRSIVCRVVNTNYVRFQTSDTIGHVSSLSFDAATFEIWGALLNGARLLVISKDQILASSAFAQLLERHRVTVMFLTVAVFNRIAQHTPQAFRLLRDLLIGGEPPDPRWVRQVMRAGRPQRILNAYGPTETTTFACCYEIPEPSDGELAALPIGSPIANTRAYIVDGRQQPVPIGVPGELLIGGDGLAREYFRRPELTREKFIADPFSEEAGGRLYRTGDVARFRADGAIEYLGRIDRQVKLRGFRIEPGEIEAAARRHPGVDDAVVMLIETDDDKRLVAYIQSAAGRVSKEEIKVLLQRILPPFEIPAQIVVLGEFPLTVNGKIDRDALRAIAPEANDVAVAVPPRDALERSLLEIWESTLTVRGIGTTENFFDLGGHSLAAMRVFSRIEAVFGKALPIALLFESPTIAGLANQLRRHFDDDRNSCLVEIQRGGSEVPVFLVHGIGGNVVGFRELALLLGPDRPVFGLQAHGLGHGEPTETDVESMADRYVTAVRAKWPSGPYVLAGFSFGGVVAFEMARRITNDGGHVALLALLDAAALGADKLLPASVRWRRRVTGLGQRAVAQLTNLYRVRVSELGGYLAQRWRTVSRRTRSVVWRLQFRLYSGLHPAVHAALFRDEVDVPARFLNVSERLTLAAQKYTPRPYGGDVTLFRAAIEPAEFRDDPTLGWSGLVGSLDIRRIPGQHETLLLPPSVAVLAAELRRLLRKIVDHQQPSNAGALRAIVDRRSATESLDAVTGTTRSSTDHKVCNPQVLVRQ